MKLTDRAVDHFTSVAASLAVDPDGGSWGKSVAQVVADLRGRSWGSAEVSADGLADLIELLHEMGVIVDG